MTDLSPENLDPAPDPIEDARKRADNFVFAMCSQAMLAVKERRDQLDNLMANIETSRAALVHYIGEFAACSADAIQMCNALQAEIEKANLPFRGEPPATITQMRERFRRI